LDYFQTINPKITPNKKLRYRKQNRKH